MSAALPNATYVIDQIKIQDQMHDWNVQYRINNTLVHMTRV